MSISFKNTICVKDKICSASLPILENYVSSYNAAVVEKLSDFDVSSEILVENDIKYVNKKISLRPTYGVVSRYGLITPSASFDTIGLTGTDVKDMATVFEKMVGIDENDPTTIEYKGFDCKEAKIAKDVNLPSKDYVDAAFDMLYYAEYSTDLAYLDGVRFGVRAKSCKDWEDVIRKSRTEGFTEEQKHKIIIGTVLVSNKWTDEYFKRAKTIQNKIKAEYEEIFKQFDVIETSVEDKAPLLAGLPSLFVGGVQLVGPKFSEKLLLKIGGEI